ncbi:MAG: hypothetical protein R6W70_10650 [bacterium]
MKNRLFIVTTLIFAAFFILTVQSCKRKTSGESQRWRVMDTPDINLSLNEEKLFSSIEEFEKLLTASLVFFEKNKNLGGFSQDIKIETQSETDDNKKALKLEENVFYKNDGKEAYILTYENNHSEGWEMIWKDGFLYRKMLGGEHIRTYSMGEHNFYREKMFSVLPDIYLMLRENARLESSRREVTDEGEFTKIEIVFSDKRNPRTSVEEKQYLQNTIGIREREIDKLVHTMGRMAKSDISGSYTVLVDKNKIVKKISADISFHLEEQELSFIIKGERSVSQESYSMISAPA